MVKENTWMIKRESEDANVESKIYRGNVAYKVTHYYYYSVAVKEKVRTPTWR